MQTLVVRRGQFSVYIDETRPNIIVPETSESIARSICQDFKTGVPHYLPEESEPGLTWTAGEYTADDIYNYSEIMEKVDKARRLQNNWFRKLVSEADDDWNKFRQKRVISEMQRIACLSLKLDREWNIIQEIDAVIRYTQCKFCRAEVHPDAIICMHCRGILNMDRFKKEFVAAPSN
jgi:uncharacterized secreted protein with C-terminal beta-propeller domain